jgi:plasmid maintenance system antidote protein VapI
LGLKKQNNKTNRRRTERTPSNRTRTNAYGRTIRRKTMEKVVELKVNDIRYGALLSAMKGQGKTINELEELLNLDAPTIRNMIAGYRKLGKGIVSINRRYRFGTKQEIRKQAERHYKRALKQLQAAFALLGEEALGAQVLREVETN